MVNSFDLSHDSFVIEGLERLKLEAFGDSGFAIGASELVDVLVHWRISTFWHGRKFLNGVWVYRGWEPDYSDGALNDWLDECRIRAYVPGMGIWTTAEVHVFPDKPGRLELFDDEHLDRDENGRWFPGGEPADVGTWTQQLLAYPRTAENIPDWVWDIFKANDAIPPLYNPVLNCVDWNNKRRPVTERGTDLSVEPTIIDVSLEPGVFAKIGKKLFGGQGGSS